jgi:hypothetical protein
MSYILMEHGAPVPKYYPPGYPSCGQTLQHTSTNVKMLQGEKKFSM